MFSTILAPVKREFGRTVILWDGIAGTQNGPGTYSVSLKMQFWLKDKAGVTIPVSLRSKWKTRLSSSR
jgi:hypothetical protein